jgi:hypothetical protein
MPRQQKQRSIPNTTLETDKIDSNYPQRIWSLHWKTDIYLEESRLVWKGIDRQGDGYFGLGWGYLYALDRSEVIKHQSELTIDQSFRAF